MLLYEFRVLLLDPYSSYITEKVHRIIVIITYSCCPPPIFDFDQSQLERSRSKIWTLSFINIELLSLTHMLKMFTFYLKF